MKAYGLPRYIELEGPDLADIKRFGLSSAYSRPAGKNGEHKNSFRSSDAKRRTRRTWKKRERTNSKVNVREIHE